MNHTRFPFLSKKAFTLFELLIVIVIIVTVITAGIPSLFRAGRIFKQRQDVAIMETYFDNVRNGALTLESFDEASNFNVDTNYDGETGDTIPYFYELRIENDQTNESANFSYIANFNETGSGTDEVIIDTDTFNGYQWTYTTNTLNITNSNPLTTNILQNPNETFSLKYYPPYADLIITDSTGNSFFSLELEADSVNVSRTFTAKALSKTGTIITQNQ